MELNGGAFILVRMRSDGVSAGEEIGSLDDDGVVKGRTMVVSKIAFESECVGVGSSSS